MFKVIGGILRYIGLGTYRLGGISSAQNGDEAVNYEQILSMFGTNIVESFSNQTVTTTLAHTPKENRLLLVTVDLGVGGFTVANAATDYTISDKVITWTAPLTGS